jgi:hypothetical protein
MQERKLRRESQPQLRPRRDRPSRALPDAPVKRRRP